MGNIKHGNATKTGRGSEIGIFTGTNRTSYENQRHPHHWPPCRSPLAITRKSKPAPDFLVQDLDTTVSPATDFFEYANGGWIKSTPIPAAESGWGVGNLVQEDIYQSPSHDQRESCRHTNDTPPKPAASRKRSATSGPAAWIPPDIDKQGISPLQPEIDSIRAIHNIAGLLHIAARLQEIGVNCLF